MPKLIVKGVDGILDGDYDLPTLADLTSAEAYFIRQTCGLSGEEAIVGGLINRDAGLLVALAAIAAERLGKKYDIQALWDAPWRAVQYDLSDFEETTGDPPEPPPSDSSEPGSPGGTEGEPETSGSATNAPSGNQA